MAHLAGLGHKQRPLGRVALPAFVARPASATPRASVAGSPFRLKTADGTGAKGGNEGASEASPARPARMASGYDWQARHTRASGWCSSCRATGGPRTPVEVAGSCTHAGPMLKSSPTSAILSRCTGCDLRRRLLWSQRGANGSAACRAGGGDTVGPQGMGSPPQLSLVRTNEPPAPC